MFTRRLTRGMGWVTALAVLMLSGAGASAQTLNRKTVLNVLERTEVPGAVLEPGKYVVKLVDSDANRHIVRFLNEREDHVFATVLAIPNYRLKATDQTEFTYYERPAGQPLALRAWFYPAISVGQEFVYPKRQAASIAAAASETVPTVADEQQPAMVAEVQPEAPAPPALKQAPVESTPPPTQLAQAQPARPAPAAAPTPAPREAQSQAAEPRTLPTTTGSGFLFALLGAITLGAAAVLHLLRRQARQL